MKTSRMTAETEVVAKAARQRRSWVSDLSSPVDGVRNDALLAHALHCRRLCGLVGSGHGPVLQLEVKRKP